MDSKALGKAKTQLKLLHNRITMSFQMGHMKTWNDLFTFIGAVDMTIVAGRLDHNVNKPLEWADLKFYLDEQKHKLERSHEQVQTDSKESNVEVQAAIRPPPLCAQVPIQPVASNTNLRLERVGSGSTGSIPVAQTTVVTGKEELKSIQAKDITKQSAVDESGLHNKSNYGMFESPKWKVFHYWFQKKAVKELLHLIVGLDPAKYESIDAYKAAYLDPSVIKRPKSGALLLSPTGTGKTYIMCALFHVLRYIEYEEGRTWSHIPYLLITKTTVVEQTARVLLNSYNLDACIDVCVLNIEALRSKQGKFWVLKKDDIINGEEITTFSWKPNLNPCVVAFDESQGAKNVASIRNRGSTQGQIMCAYSDLKKAAQLVCISATPFTRVCEAKCFAVSTHKDLTYILGKRSPFPEGAKLTNDTWPTYAALIADPASPFDYVQAAIERLMEDLKDYIVRVTGVKAQFKAHNRVRVISFPNPESRERYQKAWDTFCERKAKADALKGVEGAQTECVFAIITAFTMAAEKEHSESDAAEMVEIVKNGRAAVCNRKYKGSIIEMVKLLLNKYKVSRDEISLIWGGGQTQLTQKQKDKKLIESKRKALEMSGLTVEEINEMMGLDDVEDRVIEDFPPEWRLGPQSKEDRQSEIDRFQAGITKYCFYTLKAGGVGLSLHHTDELVPQTYGKEARISLNEFNPELMAPELKDICVDIKNNNIERATKRWNKFKGEMSDQLHHILVRILKCRRKESGFVVEEDIPYNPVKQRKTLGTLSYNAIELVQGVGRVPRLTSQSDTEQDIPVFAGTYETQMGVVVSQKLRCLTSVVKAHEDWQDIIMGGNNSSAMASKVKELLATTEGLADEDDTMIDEASEEGEDE